MATINQRHQILESLDALDYVQREKVLHYIRTLLHPTRGDLRHQHLKTRALTEIRQALGTK